MTEENEAGGKSHMPELLERAKGYLDECRTSVFTEAERATLLCAASKLLSLWGVTRSQECQLLGAYIGELDSLRPEMLGPQECTTLAHLVAIHDHLRSIFPPSEEMLAYRWISMPNAAFDGESALEFMCREGPAGVASVRSYLDSFQ
ncbi:MbcA/ParS/Xre antitoxin family protein [Rhodovulum sulfidophilum]|uniref:MbcA/ParS/Xre antitoxin family protein n=1 Tax=Rhodovulum sulfidophilum TaxID=35806 RepID=UPI00138A1637|nr:MbcA/ParS/Xre antitoxin family protein [Rhodovulum sulfidophilum]NDK37019.1 DUF2384 domain-containing protein [Rhodovulum sulfidophilum]